MKRFFILIFLFFSLAAFSAAQSKRAARFVITQDGFGKVKVGMTLTQMSRALGSRLSGYGGKIEPVSCYYIFSRRKFKNVRLMMSGRHLARIDVEGKGYSTDKGAKVGDTEAKIKRLYKGRYKVSTHKYDYTGHYIEVVSKDGKYAVIFETDGKRVTSFYSGRFPEVEYVEHCL